MLCSLRKYRFISAVVATLLVVGVTAPVAHFVCAAAFGAFQSEGVMHSAAASANDAKDHVPCFPAEDEAPPVADTSCCLMAAAETDQATIPAIPHVPLLKSLVATVELIGVAEPTIELRPAPSSGSAFLPPGAPRQALLAVFLI